MPRRTYGGSDDLAWPGFNLDDAYYGDEDSNPFEIQADRPRATAMARFDDEEGCGWKNVRCLRVYARPLTRQESWDAGAVDRYIDDRIDEWLGEKCLRWTNGAYRDSAGVAYEPPNFITRVPDDWAPDEGDPTWVFCGRDDPRAVRGWRCEA